MDILARFLTRFKPKTSAKISLMEKIQGIRSIPTDPLRLKLKILKRGKDFEPISSAVIIQKI
jgi:hypothetical protein